jgi:hypothetical protein
VIIQDSKSDMVIIIWVRKTANSTHLVGGFDKYGLLLYEVTTL